MAKKRAEPVKAEATEWYKADQKPAYSGFYDRQQPDGSVLQERFSLDSNAWFTPSTNATFERAADSLPWRGVQQPE